MKKRKIAKYENKEKGRFVISKAGRKKAFDETIKQREREFKQEDDK